MKTFENNRYPVSSILVPPSQTVTPYLRHRSIGYSSRLLPATESTRSRHLTIASLLICCRSLRSLDRNACVLSDLFLFFATMLLYRLPSVTYPQASTPPPDLYTGRTRVFFSVRRLQGVLVSSEPFLVRSPPSRFCASSIYSVTSERPVIGSILY